MADPCGSRTWRFRRRPWGRCAWTSPGSIPIDRYNAEGTAAADGAVPRTLGGEASGLVDGRPVVVVGAGLGSAPDGHLHIPIDRTIPLEKVNEAFAALGDRSVAGKILLELDPPR